MKSVEQQKIKKLCNFYVSEVHLSVMLLPYINNEINEDVEVTTIFKNLERKNFEKILDKLNVENKAKILDINWIRNEDVDEGNLLESIKKNKKNTIIIEGNKDYIIDTNKKINKILNKNRCNFQDIKIIDCYNVEEVGDEMRVIVKEYDEVLNTLSGIKSCG